LCSRVDYRTCGSRSFALSTASGVEHSRAPSDLRLERGQVGVRIVGLALQGLLHPA